MEGDEQLVLLSLDLVIGGLWENELVRMFPEVSFVVQDSYPSGNNSFFGLLKIEGGNIAKIKRFLRSDFPDIFLDGFCEEQRLFYYLESDFFLSDVLSRVNGILIWPIKFNDSFKKIKIVLKRKYVEEFIGNIEDKKIEISNFSIVNTDFNMSDILTDKQRDVFLACLMFGYYDFPKRVSLNELAGKIKLSPSTLCVHLQKIESKFFNSSSQDLFFRRMVV